jgi:glycosyltransferase involved in cell wall biosynthesis
MKVAMLGWEFPPFIAGGLGIHCLELTTRLAAHGADITFYMPHMRSIEGDQRVADLYHHMRIVEVEAETDMGPYEGRRGYDENFNEAVAVYNARLVDAFDSHDADVIHCHDWITLPAALEIRKRAGVPLVFTVHSTEFDRSAGFFPQQWVAELEEKGVRSADAVIAVSKYTKSLLVDRYGAPEERVFPVHNGVDFAKFADVGERNYGRGREYVLFLSRLSRQKGPLYFMKAARRVLEERPSTKFLVAGKGEMLPECIDYAVEHGIADRVQFSGYVPAEELATIYDKSAVYVLPSVSEPFGISILEAMTTGVPTVVSKTAGVGEALTHVLKADYWDSDEIADMVLALMQSQPMREELGRNGAREVRKFTWQACARKTMEVYQWAVLNRNGGQAA